MTNVNTERVWWENARLSFQKIESILKTSKQNLDQNTTDSQREQGFSGWPTRAGPAVVAGGPLGLIHPARLPAEAAELPAVTQAPQAEAPVQSFDWDEIQAGEGQAVRCPLLQTLAEVAELGSWRPGPQLPHSAAS